MEGITKKYYSASELAEMAGISVSSTKIWIDKLGIRSYYHGKFDREQSNNFLKQFKKSI